MTFNFQNVFHTGLELTCHDSRNMIHFSFFTKQFFLPSQKTMILKHNVKQEKKFFLLKNAGWIASKILHIFFNENQINQWYLSNNEDSCHYIYFNNNHREKLCFTKFSTIIY